MRLMVSMTWTLVVAHILLQALCFWIVATMLCLLRFPYSTQYMHTVHVERKIELRHQAVNINLLWISLALALCTYPWPSRLTSSVRNRLRNTSSLLSSSEASHCQGWIERKCCWILAATSRPSFTMTNRMKKKTLNTFASISLNASDAPSFSISGDTIGSSLLPSPSN